MSLVIQYCIGDVQDSLGVSASEMTCVAPLHPLSRRYRNHFCIVFLCRVRHSSTLPTHSLISNFGDRSALRVLQHLSYIHRIQRPADRIFYLSTVVDRGAVYT